MVSDFTVTSSVFFKDSFFFVFFKVLDYSLVFSFSHHFKKATAFILILVLFLKF